MEWKASFELNFHCSFKLCVYMSVCVYVCAVLSGDQKNIFAAPIMCVCATEIGNIVLTIKLYLIFL